MFFSFLIASKNEEVDIKNVINSCLNQTYKKYEIVVVDDSTDSTKRIVKNYTNDNIKLVEGKNTGCCNARNLGIIKSTGDIIVFLTADTILPKDFLEKILKHYEDGYDWVTVSSEILNQKYIFPRFIEAQHKYVESNIKNIYTTQGYSVTKKAALEVDMISGGIYPFNFCRDWTLGEKLSKKKYKKIHDNNIFVFHNSPYKLSDYWNVRKTRGLMSAYQPYYFFNRSINYLLLKFTVKTVISFLKIVLVAPLIFNLFKISKFSNKKIFNIFLFLPSYLIQEFAFRYGEFNGLLKIINKKKND
jgi:glycosyltransferase involved in cell wall biosynthesis